MTGEAVPINEAELLEYMRHCRQLELDGDRQSYQIGPFTCLTMIGVLQLALRHPEMQQGQRDQITAVVEGFRPWFAGTLGEQLIDLGYDEAFDR